MIAFEQIDGSAVSGFVMKERFHDDSILCGVFIDL